VPGLQNIFNALAACAAGLCLNKPPEHIIEGLHRFSGIKGRFMVTTLPGNIILVDDTYNSNPSSLKSALESIRALVEKNGKIIVCLGDMLELGESSVSAHREAGRMVAELSADLFIVMGKYAREMRDGALMAGLPHDRVEEAGSHQEILKRIKDGISDGTLVFLKGSHKVGLENVVEGLVCQA
jgi:UDP-N-acetylmuramoyl-tripeptide--D-alanyl-D-alanine ligase